MTVLDGLSGRRKVQQDQIFLMLASRGDSIYEWMDGWVGYFMAHRIIIHHA